MSLCRLTGICLGRGRLKRPRKRKEPADLARYKYRVLALNLRCPSISRDSAGASGACSY
jgi:hypothetical protein